MIVLDCFFRFFDISLSENMSLDRDGFGKMVSALSRREAIVCFSLFLQG
ncbi:hypothetical protein VDG1235_456 [Verrucomicrobiia bacterium DG1235]|nr:hypothetical protein VDG1235_456 [Verrucomicrobiae bacterium DG1235]